MHAQNGSLAEQLKRMEGLSLDLVPVTETRGKTIATAETTPDDWRGIAPAPTQL